MELLIDTIGADSVYSDYVDCGDIRSLEDGSLLGTVQLDVHRGARGEALER